jgi:hypothetical protein
MLAELVVLPMNKGLMFQKDGGNGKVNRPIKITIRKMWTTGTNWSLRPCRQRWWFCLRIRGSHQTMMIMILFRIVLVIMLTPLGYLIKMIQISFLKILAVTQ